MKHKGKNMESMANTTDPGDPNGSSLTTHCRLQTGIVADVHNLHLVHLLYPTNQYNMVSVLEICDANDLLVNLMQYSGVLRKGLLVTVDVTYNELVSDISCILCCYLDTYPLTHTMLHEGGTSRAAGNSTTSCSCTGCSWHDEGLHQVQQPSTAPLNSNPWPIHTQTHEYRDCFGHLTWSLKVYGGREECQQE
jgi:hypothetical protein